MYSSSHGDELRGGVVGITFMLYTYGARFTSLFKIVNLVRSMLVT